MSVYTDTMRRQVFTPEAEEACQQAGRLLRCALGDVQAAMSLLAPVAASCDTTARALMDHGHDLTFEEENALRGQAPAYRDAVDLAFTVLDQAKRIEHPWREEETAVPPVA